MMAKFLPKEFRMKISIFLLVAFVWPLFLSLLIKDNSVAEVFGVYMMILPTFAVMTGRIIDQKKICGWLQWIYVIAFALFTIVILLCLARVMSGNAANKLLQVFLLLSTVLFLACCIDEQELYPFRNIKEIVGIYLLFFVINLVAHIPEITLDWNATILEILSELSIMPINILLIESIYYFGEEYAWRGCLMGRLQSIFGRRTGAILLGIIWELWHMPLWFTYYALGLNDMMAGLLIFTRFVHTTGLSVFMGWAYMKTNNIWICVLIHGLNNAAAFGYGLYGENQISMSNVISALACGIIMLVFLLTKEYKKEL